MVPVRQMLIDPSRYDFKATYGMNPQRIVIHNTANDASANNEINYMNTNNVQVSFHFAIDDIEIVQGLPLDRNGWHAGDGGLGKGNREGIAIEICYSKSGGPKFEAAERNSAEFVAQLLKERGWGIDRVTKHQDYSGKYCPHRTLDMGWDRFLEMVKSFLNEPAPTPVDPFPGVSDEELAKRVWLGEFGNGEDRKNALGIRYDSVQALVDQGIGKPEETKPTPVTIVEGDSVIVTGVGVSASDGTGVKTRLFEDVTMKVIDIREGKPYPYALNQYNRGTANVAAHVTAWFRAEDIRK